MFFPGVLNGHFACECSTVMPAIPWHTMTLQLKRSCNSVKVRLLCCWPLLFTCLLFTTYTLPPTHPCFWVSDFKCRLLSSSGSPDGCSEAESNVFVVRDGYGVMVKQRFACTCSRHQGATKEALQHVEANVGRNKALLIYVVSFCWASPQIATESDCLRKLFRLRC